MGGFNRRQLLKGVGVVSLGGLLAACANDDDSGAATTAEVTTTAGATVTVQPSTTGGLTADRFDASATCTVSPELTEGPYYFDVDSIRSDIREDREGTTLRLGVRVRDAATCTAIESALVDIWHCDALGIYSGFESASQGSGGGGGPGGGGGRTDEETYLRGAQVTNADGIAEFLTIHPGWYRGRTVHIHAKVHIDRSTALTTQLFFDEDVTARIYASAPYADDSGRDTFNDGDGIFDERLVLTLSEEGDQVLGLMTLDVGAA